MVHVLEPASVHIRFYAYLDTGEALADCLQVSNHAAKHRVGNTVKIVPGGESPHSDFERMLVSVIIGSKGIVFVQTLQKPLRVGTGGVNNKGFVSLGYHV